MTKSVRVRAMSERRRGGVSSYEIAKLKADNQELRAQVATLLIENENLKEAVVKLTKEYKGAMLENASKVKALEEKVAELEKGTAKKASGTEKGISLLNELKQELNAVETRHKGKAKAEGIAETVGAVSEDIPKIAYEPAEPISKAVEPVVETTAPVTTAERTEQVDGKEIKVVTDPNDTKIKKGVHHKPWEAYGLKKTTYYKRKAEGTLPELKVSEE